MLTAEEITNYINRLNKIYTSPKLSIEDITLIILDIANQGHKNAIKHENVSG